MRASLFSNKQGGSSWENLIRWRFFSAWWRMLRRAIRIIRRQRFDVSVKFVNEMVKLKRTTGSLAPSQAKKYDVGMVLAHQYLGKLTSGLQEAFAANTPAWWSQTTARS